MFKEAIIVVRYHKQIANICRNQVSWLANYNNGTTTITSKTFYRQNNRPQLIDDMESYIPILP